LTFEECEMLGIYFGDEERHGVEQPVVPRVADDQMACLGEGSLDLTSDRGIETGEHQLWRIARPCAFDDLVGDFSWQTVGQPPGSGVAELLALGPLARAEKLHFEPRVVRKQCDELLADHAGRAKDANGNSRHVCTALLQKKSRHGQTVSAGFS